jgi:acyl-CoA synthetase (AMP-forming)/AMP-acid ligase II
MNGLMMNFPLTTNAILEYGSSVYGDKELVSKLPDGSWHRYTYADLYKRTKRLANALKNKLGVQKGDRVATFAWNHYQHVELYYAIPGVGGVCNTINLRLSNEQIAYIINHAGNTIIFVDATVVNILEKIADQITCIKTFIVINADSNFKTTLPNWMHYEELLNGVIDVFEWEKVEENDACGLCYTSGTTGNPKGALYSHRSTYLHAFALTTPNALSISAMDRFLVVVPQFHVMAWGVPFCCLLSGADMIMPSNHLKPDQLVDIIIKEKVTKGNGVPTIWNGVYNELKQNPPKEKLTLKEYIVGGSALSYSLISKFYHDFGVLGIGTWGMTECSPLCTTARIQPKHLGLSIDEQLKIYLKPGLPQPGAELRTVDEDGNVIEKGSAQVGEFEVRGNWIISSYYKFEDNSSRFSKDGWFKTGDVGYFDKDGYMIITDRSKDLIKSGGEWISSIALELALMAHPKIKEASVIAIPDEKWEERPLPCLVLEKGETITVEEIRKFLSADFASYQIPGSFALLNEIPKTSVGKLDKKEMRRLYAIGEIKQHENAKQKV